MKRDKIGMLLRQASKIILSFRYCSAILKINNDKEEQIDKGLIDIGLLLETVDIEKYEFIRLATKEKWVVLMRSDDELAKKESVSAKDLSELPVILPRRLSVQSELASWFGDYYANLHVLVQRKLIP